MKNHEAKQSATGPHTMEIDATSGEFITANGARLPAFITPDDVQTLLGCSRKAAIRHMKRAGVAPVFGRLLRTPARHWDNYARNSLGIHSRILLLRRQWPGTSSRHTARS